MEGKILMKNLLAGMQKPLERAIPAPFPTHSPPHFLGGPALSFGDMNADNVS